MDGVFAGVGWVCLVGFCIGKVCFWSRSVF